MMPGSDVLPPRSTAPKMASPNPVTSANRSATRVIRAPATAITTAMPMKKAMTVQSGQAAKWKRDKGDGRQVSVEEDGACSVRSAVGNYNSAVSMVHPPPPRRLRGAEATDGADLVGADLA